MDFKRQCIPKNLTDLEAICRSIVRNPPKQEQERLLTVYKNRLHAVKLITDYVGSPNFCFRPSF